MSGKTPYDRADIVPKVCARLSEGEPLTWICRDIGIDDSTIRAWKREDVEIRKQLRAARKAGYDAIAHRMRLTARGLNEDGSTREGKDTQTRILRDKLIVETDDKLLAKWDPERYGNKQKHELSGELNVKRSPHDLTDEELAAIATAGRTGTADPA